MFVRLMVVPFSTFHGKSGSASFFYRSLTQPVDGMISLALCLHVLSQAPQHPRPSYNVQSALDGCAGTFSVFSIQEDIDILYACSTGTQLPCSHSSMILLTPKLNYYVLPQQWDNVACENIEYRKEG